jgi:ABC-type bacteriocin/lantibiotic exporter with double-glycine peptidase domain
MRRIFQECEVDCGIACVAMLLQRYADCPPQFSYKAAKAVMFENKKIKRTQAMDIKRALNIYGINLDARKRKINELADKSKDLFLATKPSKNNKWHWMIWDAQRQMLIDPEKRKRRKMSDVQHYLIVNP